MLNCCDNDIIKIDYQVFTRYSSLFNNTNIPNKYVKKKEELLNTYNCFKTSFEQQLTQFVDKRGSTFPKHNENMQKPYKRLYIISSNFSKEENLKKSFTSCLNKLSEENKTKMYDKIVGIANSTKSDDKNILYEILWNFIKQSPDKLYIQLLQKVYDEDFLTRQFDKYVVEKMWFPPEYILNQNIYGLQDDKYDIYCNYVKWKKMSINSIKAWNMILVKNKVNLYEKLYDDVLDLLRTTYVSNYKKRKHVFDYCIDKLYLMMSYTKNEKVLQDIRLFELDSLEMSSKFLIKNILEL